VPLSRRVLLLDTKDGEKAIRMEAVTEAHWRQFWLVASLALKTAEAGPAARPTPASAAPPSRRLAPSA
jgi:hypothetical protein